MYKVLLFFIIVALSIFSSWFYFSSRFYHIYTSKDKDMVKIHVNNNSRCKLFFGVTNPLYNTDISISENQPFLISSSGCNGLLIKSNSEFIKFVTIRNESPHKQFDNILLAEGAVHMAVSDCENVKQRQGMAGYICANADGELYWFAANGQKRKF